VIAELVEEVGTEHELYQVTVGYVPPGLAASLLAELTGIRPMGQMASDGLDELSERERQILEGVADGLSNKEIGYQLGLTEKTVKHYMTNILQKLQVRNRVEAALPAQKRARRAALRPLTNPNTINFCFITPHADQGTTMLCDDLYKEKCNVTARVTDILRS
jgi:DNA-binding CsgD family transcriptional regulator